MEPTTPIVSLYRTKFLLAATFAAGLLALGASPAEAAERACIPGVQVECSCLGGSKAVQVCAPDGASFLPCQCAAAAGPPPAYGPAPYGAAPPPPPAYGAPGPGAPPPPPVSGDAALDVTSAAPGTIVLDGGEVGRAPMRLAPISAGTHVVRIRYDTGGDDTRKVRVLPGQVTTVAFAEEVGVNRRGVKHAFSAGLGYLAQGGDHPGFGVSPEYALNVGVTRRLELRFGVRALFGPGERGFTSMFGVPFSARLNLGQTYTIGAGGYFGFRSAKAQDWEGEDDADGPPRPTETGMFSGPEVFPAILRLGDKKQLELFLAVGYFVALSSSEQKAYDVFNISLGGSFLLL
jgi:hypothetical protein